jgi:hypothetical protein
MKRKLVDEQWDHLMDLCRREKELASGDHGKLLRLVGKEIDRLASEMGFTPRQVADREFRAERVNGRIVRLIAGSD